MDTQLHLNRSVGVVGWMKMKIPVAVSAGPNRDLYQHQVAIDPTMDFMILVIIQVIFNMKIEVLNI